MPVIPPCTRGLLLSSAWLAACHCANDDLVETDAVLPFGERGDSRGTNALANFEIVTPPSPPATDGSRHPSSNDEHSSSSAPSGQSATPSQTCASEISVPSKHCWPKHAAVIESTSSLSSPQAPTSIE